MKKIEDRANTPEEKKAVLDRLYEIWCKFDYLRLGQLLCSTQQSVFYIEDKKLIQILERLNRDCAE